MKADRVMRKYYWNCRFVEIWQGEDGLFRWSHYMMSLSVGTTGHSNVQAADAECGLAIRKFCKENFMPFNPRATKLDYEEWNPMTREMSRRVFWEERRGISVAGEEGLSDED